jgi:hypothetical protein
MSGQNQIIWLRFTRQQIIKLTLVSTSGETFGLKEIVCYTGRFIMFSVITNIYNKKTKGPTLMELFTATRKLEKFIF